MVSAWFSKLKSGIIRLFHKSEPKKLYSDYIFYLDLDRYSKEPEVRIGWVKEVSEDRMTVTVEVPYYDHELITVTWVEGLNNFCVPDQVDYWKSLRKIK
jgi:hypothetical protein